MRIFLANIVYFLHIIIFTPVFLAFFYKTGPWLKYNILVLPFILMDWYDYDDQCSITSLEAKLRGTWSPGTAENEGAPAFFQPLLNKLLSPFGVTVSREFAGKINMLLFLVALVVSYLRYMRYKKISLLPGKDIISKIYTKFIAFFGLLWVTNLLWKGQI